MKRNFSKLNSSKSEEVDNRLIAQKFNNVRLKLMKRYQYETAAFIGEQIIQLKGWTVHDGLVYVQCLYHLKQYHRAAFLIQQNRLYKNSIKCRCLLIKCLMKIKKYKEAFICLESIGYVKFDEKWKLTLLVLKSIAQAAMDNREDAKRSLYRALEQNIMCYEAFSNITCHHMASKREEIYILVRAISKSQIDRNKFIRGFMQDFMKFFYYLLLKKYDMPDRLVLPEPFSIFSECNDYLVACAERLFYNFESPDAIKITKKVLQRDKYNFKCLQIHVSCLLDLKLAPDLFLLSQNLVDLCPENEVSWFALGCYYHLIGYKELSQRYLQKAITLNDVMAPAWLLLGNSFSEEGQHDQAMMSYFKAAHLMPGCHLPLLYIGVEYAKTDNHKIGEKFIMKALNIAPKDPLVLHELSVTAFHTDELFKAERHMRHALKVIKYPGIKGQDFQQYPYQYEPIFVNMGHILRKLGRYTDALEFFNRALSFFPNNASTYTSIGLVYCMMDHFYDGLRNLDRAYSLNRFHYRRRDNLTKELLQEALKYYPPILKLRMNIIPRMIICRCLDYDEDVDNPKIIPWTERRMQEKIESVKKLIAERGGMQIERRR